MSRAMKDSGIDWIGEIPVDWEILRGKTVFSQRNSKGNNELRLLSATQKQGMLPQDLLEGVVLTSENTDLSTFKTVHKNDFVISLRSFQGGFEKSNYEGVCSPAYQVFYNRVPIHHDFFWLLFKSLGFIDKINSLTVGIREGKNILYKDFSNMLLAIPPVAEQEAIAAFLDRKCGEVDEMVSLQEQVIEELKAYKQSVITEAVTKGLNPSAPMKPTNIDWIGEIPSHWETCRIKNKVDFNPSCTHPLENIEVSYMPMECLRFDDIEKRTALYEDVKGYTPFEEGDIVMAKVTPCFENGNIAVATGLKNGIGFGTSEIFVIRCEQNCYKRYVFYYLRTPYILSRGVSSMTGTGGLKRVNPKHFLDSALILPPLSEQREIADYLDRKCADIDALIALKQQKIEELKQYKKSLIYEYVTGKKQVFPS